MKFQDHAGHASRPRSYPAGTPTVTAPQRSEPIAMPERLHEANRRRWDAASRSWVHRADTRGIWKRCHRDPSLALHSAELRWLSDCAAKSAAVLGSGDNQVVFALSGLGAR